MKPAFLLAALALLSLAACEDNSVKLVSADQLAQFKPGTTNQTEVVAALGKPLHTIVEANGLKVDQYGAEEGSSSNSGMLMPGFLVGGSPQNYKMISFEYTSNGTLKEIKK
jgi:hypothetical protein